ncbi:unnamed protein product [Closterium sp. NIES-65]|nr:unnamed protein product [Closterium sp. NIES-65]
MNRTVPLFSTFWTYSPPTSLVAEFLSDDRLLLLMLRSLMRESFYYALVSKRWFSCTSVATASLFYGCRKLRDLRLLTLNHLTHLPPTSLTPPTSQPSISAATLATITNITSLRSFSLQSQHVKRLTEHVIGAMTRLEKLLLRWVSIQSLPDTMCSFPLSSLSIQSCAALTSLPDNLGSLVQLETLVLERLPNLRALPESVGNLHRLWSLGIEQQVLLELPESLCTWSVRHSLALLFLRSCSELRRLPPQLAMLTRLEELEITGCPLLDSLEPLFAPNPPYALTFSLASALSVDSTPSPYASPSS